MSRPTRTVAPSSSPVTLAEAKSQCRIDTSDEDTLIQTLIDAATAHLDGWSGVLGRCIITQTWTFGLADWQDKIRLPFPDISSVTINYVDADGVSQSVASLLFELVDDALGSAVWFKGAFTQPSLYSDQQEPITITIVAGYGAASNVPASVKQAILLLVGHLYENREAVSDITLTAVPMAFDALIGPHRYSAI